MSGEITLKMVFFKPKKGKFIANANNLKPKALNHA
jgi:hypothetical protein